MLELKSTSHSYYCHEANRHDISAVREYETWEEFKSSYFTGENYDDDYDHIFRFDIFDKAERADEGEDCSGFTLALFCIQQRRGYYTPIIIETITLEDMPEISDFLQKRWQYLEGQWSEFSNTSTLRSELDWYACEMEKQLRANEDKCGWQNEMPGHLANDLIKNLGAYIKAMELGDLSYAIKCAVDCGNFSMMLADLAKQQKDYIDRDGCGEE